MNKIILYETPNCYTTCIKESISNDEWVNFMNANGFAINEFVKSKGIINYDDRK